MGSLERRLEALETKTGKSREDEEDRVSREALRRITDEDLHLVHTWLERAVGKADGAPTEEEEGAILRYEAIKEEVRSERTQTAREVGSQP